MENYNVVNGTAYHLQTPQAVINVLETAKQNRTRIKVYYGDVVTGKCWNEEYDTMGYIGRSTGIYKIPLLIAKKNSCGGGGLLDHCIIKIRESKGSRVLYQAANFQQPIIEIKAGSDVEGYTHETFIDGELYGRHKSEVSAKRLKNKLS